MNIGVLCAISSALLYPLREVFFKHLLKKGFDRNIIQFSYRTISIFIAFLIIAFSKSESIFLSFDYTFIMLIVAAGILGFLADSLYYKALSNLEIGVASILGKVSPVISLLISFIFLKELPNEFSIFGIILMVGASIWVVRFITDSGKGGLKNKYVLSQIGGMTLYILISLITRNLSSRIGVVNYVLYYSIVASPTFLISSLKSESFALLKKQNLKNLTLLFVYSIFAFAPLLISTIAYKEIMLPVAYALSSFSIIFTMVFGYIFLDEKENLFNKAIAGGIMLLGGWLAVQ
jgi:transporter family protein